MYSVVVIGLGSLHAAMVPLKVRLQPWTPTRRRHAGMTAASSMSPRCHGGTTTALGPRFSPALCPMRRHARAQCRHDHDIRADARRHQIRPCFREQAADALEATASTSSSPSARSQVARSADHISRWCRQGTLRATKQPTRNGLSRYLIEQRSIDEVLERLRREKHEREHPQVFEAMTDTTAARRHNGGTDNAAAMSPRHHDGIDDAGMPSSVPLRPTSGRATGRMPRSCGASCARSRSRPSRTPPASRSSRVRTAICASPSASTGARRILEKQLNLLMAPKPAETIAPELAPETPADGGTTAAPTPTSWWRRVFGGS